MFIPFKSKLVFAGILFLVSFQTALAVPPATSAGTTEALVSPYYVDADAGILVGGGDGLPGFNVRLNGKINTETPLFLGGEVGLFFFSNYYSSGVVVPILANLTTVFSATRQIRPQIGVSAGPVISTGDGYSTARFGLFLNPGATFDLSRDISMNVLARFGIIGSNFVALPELGLSFAI